MTGNPARLLATTGPPPPDVRATAVHDRCGSAVYLAKHISAIRLERHRLGNADTVPETYEQMRDILDQLQE